VASVYSARPTTRASVSLPCMWEELANIYPADFTISSVPSRLAKTGDIWKDIFTSKKNLDAALEVLA
jgi:DNA primase